MAKKRAVNKKGKMKSKILVYLFFFLVVLNIVLGSLKVAKDQGLFIPKQPKPLVVNGEVNLEDLTLRQKIGQMVVVMGIKYYSEAIKKMQVGGIHLGAMESKGDFEETIKTFQEGMEIPLMTTADLEGCINPFANFKDFGSNSKVKSVGEAFQKGKTEGKFLSEIGITIDFAPVVDLNDEIWGCRSFPEGKENVSELANAYMLGLQDEGILATVKHYPGKTLIIKDPHKYLAAAEITNDDLYPYQVLLDKKSVKAIMVSHLITFGKVNSEGKPSAASKRIIDGLRGKFDGLIITDEINMLGLKNFYDTEDEMFVEIFKGGADIILDFNQDPNKIYQLIEVVAGAVEKGEISESRIDASVKKILEFKGFRVKG